MEEGDPLGRAPQQGAQPRRRSLGVLRARGGPGVCGGPAAASRSRGARCSRGSTGIPRRAGSRGYAGDPGCARSQGCAALQGARSGTSAAAGAVGAGVGSVCPAAPEPGSEGRRAAARPLPGLRHAAPRPGGRERGGRESSAEPGRAGGWGRRGGGRGGPGAGRGGRGAGAARGRAGRRESGRAPRPGAARRGLMGMAGARSLLSCSLACSLTHARREAKPAAATSQLSKLPSATFSSPPLPAPPPPSSLPLPLACSPPGRSFRVRPPEGARAEASLGQTWWALRWMRTWRTVTNLGAWATLVQSI